MGIVSKLQFLMLSTVFFSTLGFAYSYDTAPIPLTGGTVGPNQTLKIPLEKALVFGRYYQVTCDIESPSYASGDPVVMRFTGGWTATNTGATGGIGKITLNGHNLSQSQGLLDLFINKYVVTDVWIGSIPPSFEYLHLELRFENYHKTSSVTVKNCFADYMVD